MYVEEELFPKCFFGKESRIAVVEEIDKPLFNRFLSYFITQQQQSLTCMLKVQT